MLGRLWPRLARRAPPFAEIAPDQDFIALGDLHGRRDLLEAFLARGHSTPLVCLGDYVDRGDDSAGVLRILQDRPDIICLSGNHEELMLRFIAAPERHGARWLRYGGLQTLASFGIAGMTETSDSAALVRARDQLVESMGTALLDWLGALPTHWMSGNVLLAHAGADPSVPADRQDRKTLHWGHSEFRRRRRSDGIWVLHGHTIVDQAKAQDGRISIDTGAYATGRLTAAHVSSGTLRFETIAL